MKAIMHDIGINPVITLRIIIGVGLFWVFRSYTIGRRYFLTNWGADRYIARLTKTRSKWRQTIWDCRHYFLAGELMIAMALTCAVVGNNIRAYLTLFH